MELPAPARTNASKRLSQPVGVILAAQIGASAHAGAQLGRRNRIRAVIRLEPHDAPVAYVRDQQAAPSTVMCRAADPDPFFGDGLHSPSVRSSPRMG